jgi:6-phosphogluconolactonase
MAQLKIVADKTAMSETAAERVTRLVEAAIGARGVAAISLTGGTTPDLLYQFLADRSRPWRDRIDWAHVHLFWSDEREVPPDHPQSNFGLANRLLLQHVPVPDTQIHRMRGELPASDAGPLYDALLHARRAQIAGPLFDIMLLGIGANAHIASIFPNSPLLIRGPEGSAPHTTGQSGGGQGRTRAKADAIAATLEGSLDVERYPAQLLRAAGHHGEWIIDSAASARLRAVPPA